MQDKNKVYYNIHTHRRINFYDETCSFVKLAILESYIIVIFAAFQLIFK